MKRTIISSIILLAVLVAGVGPASAAEDYYWTNTVAGNTLFTNSAVVWQGTTPPPGVDDTANFTNKLTYGVELDQSVLNAAAFFNAFGGTVTQRLTSGTTWTLTNSYVVAGNLNTTSSVLQTLTGTLAITNSTLATMIVGDQGRGTFQLGNSEASKLIADTLIIGRTNANAAAAGFFSQRLTGSSATILGNMIVGQKGTGTFTNSGATATTTIYGNLILGEQTTGTGTVYLSGGTVTVTNNSTPGKLIVGQNGYGALTLNGSTLLVDQLLVTNVTLTTANSTFKYTAGNLTTKAATIVLATNDTTSLNFSGTWTANGTTVITVPADATRTNAALTINGGTLLLGATANVTFTNNVGLLVGGAGQVIITNGAKMFITALAANITTGGRVNFSGGGTLLLSDTGSTLIATNGINSFRLSGNGGTWIVSNNAGLVTRAADVGAGDVRNNLAIVTAGGTWTNLTDLRVGEGLNANANNNNNNVLRISAGGQVISSNTYLGSNDGLDRPAGGGVQGENNNKVVVTGSGSVLTNSGEIIIGKYFGGTGRPGGTNQLEVADGGAVYAARITVGGASVFNSLSIASGGRVFSDFGLVGAGSAASNSWVTVTGTGSLWKVSGNITNGLGTVGNVISLVDSGSVVAAKVVLGGGAAGAGTLSFNGLGGAVTNTGGSATVIVGNGGVGVLVLTNGAWAQTTDNGGLGGGVTADIVQFGGTAAQSGTLAINSGGLLAITNSSTFGAFNAGGGTASIGANDNAGTTIVALNPGGTLLLTDTGLIVGDTHNGGLVLNGGSLVVTNPGSSSVGALASLIVGNNSGITGALTVAQSGLAVTNGSGDLIIGNNGGQGTLLLTNLTVRTSGAGLAGDLLANNFTVGQIPGSAGTITLSGTTTFTLSNNVAGNSIAVAGDTLTLGSANIKGSLVLNPGSTLAITSTTLVVNNGALILNGGVIANSLGTTTLNHLWATNSTSSVLLQAGTLTTLDSSTLLTNSTAAYTIGTTGPATWNVFGGTNTIQTTAMTTLGVLNSQSGYINVSNAVLNVSGLTVYGGLTIRDGGILKESGALILGGYRNPASPGTLLVESGGQLLASNGVVDLYNGAYTNRGTMVVSTLRIANYMDGNGPTKATFFMDQGQFTATNSISLANGNDTSNGGILYTQQFLHAGGTVNNGGTLTVVSSNIRGDLRALVQIGGGATAATWTNAGAVRVVDMNGATGNPGGPAWGLLTVTNNGTMIVAGDISVGAIANNTRTAANFYRGTGTVAVVDGGKLVTTGNFNLGTISSALASNAVAVATLNIGATSGDNGLSQVFVTNSGETATLQIGAWSNSVANGAAASGVLNLKSGTLTVDKLIATNGYTMTSTVNFTGGALITKSTTIAKGSAFAVGDGTQVASLALANALNGTAGYHRFADGLTIADNATLKGNGTVIGATTVSSGGTLSPGFSLGSMTFSNDLNLAGTYRIELDGGNSAADYINVLGTLNLTGATFSFTNLNVASTNSTIVFGHWAGITGTNAMTSATSGLDAGAFATSSTTLITTNVPVVYLNYLGGNELAITIPEPSAMTLVGIGLFGAAVLLRRRRQ